MAEIYCREHHQTENGLCPECRTLLSYVLERMENCPLKEGKPACSACAIHCFKPAMREEIRQVMRYAGPRMLLRHPLLTLAHFLDRMAGKRSTGRE
ncbi:MAG: nitrous oxide-stimulated promoter family protein [Deltaproteobacteria bacterium]|nr:nitrous oxide-stimulated promoter family protein [Deltaproteobacteria bacterium]